MSKVSTYIKADNGLYYRDPIYRGRDYVIVFDDEEPIEVVAANANKLQIRDRVLKILQSRDIEGQLLYPGYECKRIINRKLCKACSYFIRVHSPFPIPDVPTVGTTSITDAEYVLYDTQG